MESNNISYSIRRSKRARRMRLAVYCDGSVVVTLPQSAPANIIDRFLRKKMDWVLGKIAFFKQFNHSKSFWSLVGLGMPDYIEVKSELKKNYLRVQ